MVGEVPEVTETLAEPEQVPLDTVTEYVSAVVAVIELVVSPFGDHK